MGTHFEAKSVRDFATIHGDTGFSADVSTETPRAGLAESWKSPEAIGAASAETGKGRGGLKKGGVSP